MAYAAVTPALFKEVKPQFSASTDQAVQLYLNAAGRVVDESWDEEDYPLAIIAYACHLMTIDGLGTDAGSKAFKSGREDMQTIKSADITLVRFAKAAGSTPYTDWLNSTQCGKQFAFMLRLSKAGPRVAMAASFPAVSGYAKDAPLGWPGVFFV